MSLLQTATLNATQRRQKRKSNNKKQALNAAKNAKKQAKTKLFRDGAAKNAATKDCSHELDVLRLVLVRRACVRQPSNRALRWREEQPTLPRAAKQTAGRTGARTGCNNELTASLLATSDTNSINIFIAQLQR